MARTRILSGVIGVPVEGLLSVNTRRLLVSMYETDEERVKLIMMHDYYWYERNAGREPDWVVERVSPSRLGFNSYKGSKQTKYYGYRLVGDFTIVWECCYDNMPELYDWSLTNEENVSRR
jgi:hypothetical protein